MNLISYARVSTDDKGQNPETQHMANRNFAAAYSDTIVAEFTDEGVTGDSIFFDRPNGEKINALLTMREARGIIVFAIDRFSRRDPFKVNNEMELLRQRGITLKSVSEPFLNTDSEFRQMVQFMITWFANYFLTQHKKKVKAGMERAARVGTKSGKAIGRPKLSGWHRNRILEMRAQGMSLRLISKQLGLGLGTVHKTVAKNTGAKPPPSS